ncbi:MAG: GMC family oxidoreductase [Burkholderiales bacterium]|nr:GMC family oxidoreductase [Burkholderiales bacterium]
MTEDVDVLIIGAGASGAAFAWSMADTRMRILCLEQGDWMNPSDYPSTRRDWEVRQDREFSPNPNIRGRTEDYPINDSDSPISPLNFNGVGGSTILYAAHFPRPHPSDFRVRSLDGVADDWPLDYAALEPYYAVNDREMGVAGLAGDPAYPPHQPPLPHVPLGLAGETMARGFNALGWHWWPSDTAIATQDYEGRAKCVNLGPCKSGCAQGAKASVDVTYWPVARRAGVRLRTRCRVREILVDDNDMATGVVYFDEHGVEQVQRAEVVVLACNGIGTPRLLLNSKSARFPNGLANRSGLVGKNLMIHPWGMVRGAFDAPLDSQRGPLSCCIWSQEFYETDRSRGFVRGYNLQITRGLGPVATARMGLARGDIPWGAGHHAAFARRYGQTIGIGICCEDLPEECNTVTLDATLTDSNGIPAPKITYRVGENTERMLAHGLARGAEVMKAAGAWDVSAEGPVRQTGWHLLGTARMGEDPERSVVNGWGRSHDVKNLFIIDGSVFVTSAGVNPTPTIQAVALYVADAMKQRLANLFD